MIHHALIIMPLHNSWQWTADYLRQTALLLAQHNRVIIYDQDHSYFFLQQQRQHYPRLKNIHFHQVKYWLPGRRFSLMEKLNRWLSFRLFLLKLNLLHPKQRKILWIFDPQHADLAQHKVKNLISLYDCVDYHAGANPSLEQKIRAQEAQLIQHSDFFFVNSTALHHLHQQQAKRPLYLNAQGFFQPDEKKIKKVPLKSKKPIIGFVGGLNYRLDFPLLYQLINQNPQWQFVLWGPVQKQLVLDQLHKTERWLKKILQQNNVTYGQSKDRYQVYSLIKNFDVAIIPYNSKVPFNKYCYPMKIFEYFYFGKPVISSNIVELRQKKFRNLVSIARNVEDWQEAISKLLAEDWPAHYQDQQRAMALQNSWQQKIEAIAHVIQ